MSADLLREAAALMRERAEAATPGPWVVGHRDATAVEQETYLHVAGVRHSAPADAAHIASWHPAVALAVSKAMDDVAQAWEIADGWALDPDDDLVPFEDTIDGGWLAVARAYLGRES